MTKIVCFLVEDFTDAASLLSFPRSNCQQRSCQLSPDKHQNQSWLLFFVHPVFDYWDVSRSTFTLMTIFKGCSNTKCHVVSLDRMFFGKSRTIKMHDFQQTGCSTPTNWTKLEQKQIHIHKDCLLNQYSRQEPEEQAVKILTKQSTAPNLIFMTG